MRGSSTRFALLGSLGLAACGAAAGAPKANHQPAADASVASMEAVTTAAPPALIPVVPRTPRATPWENVPYVSITSTGTRLDAVVPLEPLEESAAALDLVVSEVTDDPGTLVDLACTDGFVAREIDRSVFDGAASAKGALGLVVTLDLGAAPASEAPLASRRFAVRACLRDVTGAIDGTADASALVVSPGQASFEDPVVDTPSGRIVQSLVRKGHVVVGWDASASKPVLAEVVRARSGGAKNVTFGVGARTISAPEARSFYLSEKNEWRAASALQIGDRLLGLDGVTSVTTAPEASSDLEVTRFETDSGGTFIDGLLTSDGSLAKKHEKAERKTKKGKAKADAGAKSDPSATDTDGAAADGSSAVARTPFTPSSEPIRWIPASQSWDCQLDTTLEIDALPAGAQAIALVVAPQTEPNGARGSASCDEGAVLREIPASFIGATGPLGGRFAVTLGEDEVDCDEGYALSVCVRGEGGALAPLADGRSRYGVAGASCFVGSTPISTPRGDLAIESLRRGDVVLALDGATNTIGTVHVTRTKALDRTDIGSVRLSSGVTLEVTSDHPFFLSDGSIVRAGDLAIGDALVSATSEAVRVESVGTFDQRGRVYDLSVDGPHDYFAGGVLVHNY